MRLRIRPLHAILAAAAFFFCGAPLPAPAETPPAEKAGKESGSPLERKLKELRDLFGKDDEDEKSDPASRAVRYVKGDHGAALQVRDVMFEGPQGQKLELTGAIHIGDAAYYEAINQHLKQFDTVLFELVASAEDVKALQKGEKRTKHDDAKASLSEIYKILADDILQLTSQMEKVDYTLPTMVHADFSDMELKVALEARKLSMEAIMGNVSPWKLKMLLNVVKLFIPKDDPAAVKRLMAPMFGSVAAGKIGGDNKVMEVIINERNKRVLEVLDAQVAAGKKNIAVFYGAGHFADLTASLLAKGWKQTGENWRTAWDIPNPPAPASKKPAEPAK